MDSFTGTLNISIKQHYGYSTDVHHIIQCFA
jgi:hypothetical protein